MEQQVCKDCSESLPLTREFFGQYKNNRNGEVRIGFRTSCRRCMAARSARHALANPDQKRAAARRRAERTGPESAISAAEAARLRAVLEDACRYCGVDLQGAGEIDHLTPLARGGGGGLNNLTLACTQCNRSKLAKTLDEYMAWRRERGLYVRTVSIPSEQPDIPFLQEQRRKF